MWNSGMARGFDFPGSKDGSRAGFRHLHAPAHLLSSPVPSIKPPTMSATPSQTSPAGDDRSPDAVAALIEPSFGDKLQAFWEKNSTVVLGVCAAAILAVAGKGLWEYMARQKELGIEQAYAAAATPDQLKSFAAANPGHSLAGIAQLRLADEAYAAGKFAEAVSGYEAANAIFKGGPLGARVKLGLGVAKIQTGKTAEGTADLKSLLDDAQQLRAIRAEAGYHLSSLAAEAGDTAQVQKISEQLLQIDPSSLWTQRALTLRMSKAATAAPAATAPSAPAPAAEAKPAESAPGVQFKLPGK